MQLTDEEYEALRRLAFERHLPMTRLVRQALDDLLGTTDTIPGPGRKAATEGGKP